MDEVDELIIAPINTAIPIQRVIAANRLALRVPVARNPVAEVPRKFRFFSALGALALPQVKKHTPRELLHENRTMARSHMPRKQPRNPKQEFGNVTTH